MGVSKPIFFREISCSSVRERSQQLRPYRVPMNCCISLLFFLVVVAHLSCDQFLDRCWKRSSFVRDEQAGIINCPRPFLRGYGSLRVVHWVRRSWQGPHPVSWSQDQRPYLFLDCWSSMSPSKVHFFFAISCSESNSALVRSWLTIWDVQFVNESTLSSGYQNPRCPFWIVWRWNFDFKSMGAKPLVRRELQWLVLSLFLQEMLHGLWIVGLLEDVCVCVLGILGWNLQHRRPRQEWSCSSYLPIPCTRTMRLSKPLWTESSRTVIRRPECFPAKCFQILVLEKKPKGSLLVNSLFRVPLFTDSTFSRVLSCPFSFSVKPNCAHQFETAL